MLIATRDEHGANHEAQEQKRDITEPSQLGESHANHTEPLSYLFKGGVDRRLVDMGVSRKKD
jgi:hypothetical protein